MRKSRLPRFSTSFACFACLFIAGLAGCGSSNDSSPSTPSTNAAAIRTGGKAAALDTKIKQFCGGCHPLPRPSSFPKHAWKEEVEQGFDLFLASGRRDLSPPSPRTMVVEYFRSRAPEQLEIPIANSVTSPPPTNFTKQPMKLMPGKDPVFISHLTQVGETAGHGKGLLICDMKQGDLLWTDPLSPDQPSTSLTKVDNPAHVKVTDLDVDGEPDYLISDLGAFFPEDHNLGKIHWLRRNPDNGQWERKLLLSDVGRVCNVEVDDFDGDDKPDLVVAEFGWRSTGRVLFLRNVTSGHSDVQFKTELIDNRTGSIHVQKCDLNGDGHLDFMALISQEHETVVAFVNRGDGFFTPNEVWSAGYPSYGSSGIEVVDLDQDGDQDVVYTNGDSFDDALIKPYHGVQWLENRGDYPYQHHHLIQMPGAYRALPGDFDGDGDVDIVAVAMLPHVNLNQKVITDAESIVLLEQTEGKQFVRHALEVGNANHATLEVGDFDDDQDLDLAVGTFWDEQNPTRLTIWWNQLVGDAVSESERLTSAD